MQRGKKALLFRVKAKRLETKDMHKKKGDRLLAGDIFGAASAGFTKMRFSVAF